MMGAVIAGIAGFSGEVCQEAAAGSHTAANIAAAAASGEAVPSPLPGTILKVNVSVGQAVKEGDVLVVIEAMKMENDVVAPRAGTITQVSVPKGATVNTGDTLVVLS